MEKYVPQCLSKMLSDIARADQEKQSSLLARQELENHTEALFQKALGILDKYGKERQENVVVGNIGRSPKVSCVVSYVETPAVTADLGGKEVQVTISTSSPYYRIVKDNIVVYSTDPTLPEESKRRLFRISQYGEAVNWLGKPATVEQITMMSEILSFIETSLSESHTPRSQRRSSS